MKNQISGDFDSETLEAFRSLYAQREVRPEELEVDQYTGLPTDVVTSVSPWIEHTGLWRANPGTERDFVPNQVLDGSREYEDLRDFDNLSNKDFDNLLESVISEIEEEEAFADLIYNSDDDDEDDVYRGEVEDEGMTDEELERIINGIMEGDREEEEQRLIERENMEVDTNLMSDEDLDNLINELLNDTNEDEEPEDEGDEEYLEDDLESMIRSIMEDSGDDELEEDDEDLDSLIRSIMEDDDDGYDESEGDFEEPDDDGELDDLIAEIMSDLDESDGSDEYGDSSGEEEMTEDEIDSLIDQIMSESEDED